MLLGDNACLLETEEEGIVGLYHLCILSTLHGFDLNGTAVDLDHDHDVLITTLGASGELSCLIGEGCFADFVC
jgi:hypothetical protein